MSTELNDVLNRCRGSIMDMVENFRPDNTTEAQRKVLESVFDTIEAVTIAYVKSHQELNHLREGRVAVKTAGREGGTPLDSESLAERVSQRKLQDIPDA